MKRHLPLLACLAFVTLGPCLRAADSRAEFLKLLDRPRVPLAPQITETKLADGLMQVAFSYGMASATSSAETPRAPVATTMYCRSSIM